MVIPSIFIAVIEDNMSLKQKQKDLLGLLRTKVYF